MINALLCSGISLYFAKTYRSFPSPYIFGLLVGFSLIAFSDLFFSMTVGLATVDIAYNALHWLQLSITLVGFAMVGLVYFFQKSNEKEFSSITKLGMVSILPVLLVITYVLVEQIEIPSFVSYNEYFRLANVLAVGYVIFSMLLNQRAKKRKQLNLLLLGFALLLASQGARLLFALEPESIALITSGLLKACSFAIILLALTKEPQKSQAVELKT